MNKFLLGLTFLFGCADVDADVDADATNDTIDYTVCNNGDYTVEVVCDNCDLTVDWSSLSATDADGNSVDSDSLLNFMVYKLDISADEVYQKLCTDKGTSKDIQGDIQSVESYNIDSETSSTFPVAFTEFDASLLIHISNSDYMQFVYVEPSVDSPVTEINL